LVESFTFHRITANKNDIYVTTGRAEKIAVEAAPRQKTLARFDPMVLDMPELMESVTPTSSPDVEAWPNFAGSPTHECD
jgi:hypothetical protein